MQPSPAEVEYPIAAVSKLTGISCHALRAWERRYGFPIPHRSPSGHRRYSHVQVLRLRRVEELLRSGLSIGEAIPRLLALSPLRADPISQVDAVVSPPALVFPAAVDSAVAELIEHLQAGDEAAAASRFDQLERALGPVELVQRIVTPILTETGERWFQRACSIYQEHFIGGFIRRKLGMLIDAARAANPRPIHRVGLGTVQGDRHEGGALAAALLLEHAGWRVLDLGVDLPIAEYARFVADQRPDALALSFILSRNINKRFEELATIRGVPVFVGGRGILNNQRLARRHGLIPIPGPAPTAVARLVRVFDALESGQNPAANETAD